MSHMFKVGIKYLYIDDLARTESKCVYVGDTFAVLVYNDKDNNEEATIIRHETIHDWMEAV